MDEHCDLDLPSNDAVLFNRVRRSIRSQRTVLDESHSAEIRPTRSSSLTK